MTTSNILSNEKTEPIKIWQEHNNILKLLKSPFYKKLFRIQDEFSKLTHNFFQEEKFSSSLSPITTGSISSPMGLGSDSIPLEIKLKDRYTYLADSMQFLLEVGVRLNPNGVYYILPSFRGEELDKRHLNQFYHVEAEIKGSLEDVQRVVSSYVTYLSQGMLNNCLADILSITGDISHIESLLNYNTFFPSIRFDEAEKELSDFPEGTEFIIKEFDVPLVNIPGKGWFNWWGGKPREYDVTMLKPGNNWEADSFEHWLKIVEESI